MLNRRQAGVGPARPSEVAPGAIRSLPLTLVAGVAALAATPAVVAAARGGSDLSGAVVAWAVVAGALAGFTAGEPGAEVLDAAPTPRAVRAADRLAGLLAVASASGALVIGLAVTRPDAPDADLRARLVEFAAVAGVSTAAAAVAERRGATDPTVAAVAGPLLVLGVSAFAYRYDWLPVLGGGTGLRWLPLAGAGWLTAVWALRDRYC